jgi:imidazolonepropionase-like amidohydrolase
MRALVLFLSGPLALCATSLAQEPGTEGGPGLVLQAAKVITASLDGPTAIDRAVVVIRDGEILEVRPQRGFEIPADYVVEDLGDLWLSPGMIDLHNHTAMGMGDLSEAAYLTNPGMRASVGARPGNYLMAGGLAGGVTCVLHIPGSATNMGGQGFLIRTSGQRYEDALVRDPGSLKLAQAGNPEGRAPWRPGRSFMNYNTRSTFRRGVTYAKEWLAYEEGAGPRPERDLQFDIFRSLVKGEAQVSTHTQIYQVVEMTLTMVAQEFGLPVYIDHGTFDGWRAAAKAEALGVPAILGPRQITQGMRARGFAEYDQDGAIFGVAAKYQDEGHTMVGFNTDCVDGGRFGPAQEELSLQASMGARYGFRNEEGQAVRGVTIVPAVAAGMDGQLGSVEAGKEATIIATTGDPTDPRCSVEAVWVLGEKVYDTGVNRRRW